VKKYSSGAFPGTRENLFSHQEEVVLGKVSLAGLKGEDFGDWVVECAEGGDGRPFPWEEI